MACDAQRIEYVGSSDTLVQLSRLTVVLSLFSTLVVSVYRRGLAGMYVLQ